MLSMKHNPRIEFRTGPTISHPQRLLPSGARLTSSYPAGPAVLTAFRAAKPHAGGGPPARCRPFHVFFMVLWFSVFGGDATVAAQHSADQPMVVAARPPARHKAVPTKKAPTPPLKKPTAVPEPVPVQEPLSPAAPMPSAGLSGSNRIEFDAQLIKGQTTKAGEVQVLERKDTELKSMIKRRTSFRDEIIRTAFPDK